MKIFKHTILLLFLERGFSLSCDEMKYSFAIFSSCMKQNDYNYEYCKDHLQNIEWDFWVEKKCYYTLNVPIESIEN